MRLERVLTGTRLVVRDLLLLAHDLRDELLFLIAVASQLQIYVQDFLRFLVDTDVCHSSLHELVGFVRASAESLSSLLEALMD